MKERRKLSGKILTVLLTVMLLVTSMAVSVPAALRITIRDGKVYQNNKPVTNKIVGSKAKGYYYVDKTGRKVNTREIRQGETSQSLLQGIAGLSVFRNDKSCAESKESVFLCEIYV